MEEKKPIVIAIMVEEECVHISRKNLLCEGVKGHNLIHFA